MNQIVQRILTIAVIMAVLCYVILNYMAGRTETDFFVVALAMLSYFLISMIRALIQDLRNR